MIKCQDGSYLEFKYNNWRGETSVRRVLPSKVWFGSTEFHTTPQWLLKAYDIDREDNRDFALNDIIIIKE